MRYEKRDGGMIDPNENPSLTDWKEVTVYTTTAGIEPIAALLEANGIEGYVIEDAADFAAFLQSTAVYWDYMDEDLMQQKSTQETCLKFYLPENDTGAAQLATIEAALQEQKAQDEQGMLGRLAIETALTRQEDWEWGWKQYWKPFPVGRTFLIKPSWETVESAGDRRILEIDPASSFGTGTHDTTQLCIAALEDTVHGGETLLDMGTGSGILAIAAALLGADVKMVVDIDPHCLETAQQNAAHNQVSIGQTLCGDVLRSPQLAAQLGDGYQIITANIVADIIIGMTPLLYQKLAAGGLLICSGILNERADEVQAALEKQGFAIQSRENSPDWTAFIAKK